MASDAKTTEISTVSLKSMRAPEMFPRGSSGDPQLDDMRSRLQDNFDIITNYFNNVVNNTLTNTVNIGFGTAAGEWVIGQKTPDVASPYTSQDWMTGGNKNLQLAPDGQLIVGWQENLNDVNNTMNYCFKKARSPFTTWTNLDETSDDATIFAGVVQASNSMPPIYCINPLTQSLLILTMDTGSVSLIQIWKYDGTLGTWAYNQSVSITKTVNISQSTKGQMIPAGGNIVLLMSGDGTNVGATYVATQAGETVWGQTADFRRYWDGATISALSAQGDQKRLVECNGKVYAFMEFFARGAGYNIAWSSSADGGVIWSAGVTAAPPPLYQIINSDNTNSGFLFPVSTGLGWLTANLMGSGFGSYSIPSWDVAHIQGTNRIGLIYRAGTQTQSGSRRSGVLYAELDTDTGKWTGQDNHFRLTPHGIAIDAPGNTFSSLQGASNSRMSGAALLGTEGTPRCFWYHGYQSNSTFNTQVGVMTRRLAAGGTLTQRQKWQSQRLVKDFASALASTNFQVAEFVGCKDTVTIGGVGFLPVLWTRQGDASAFKSTHELCFQLLPLAVLDAP